MLRVFASQYLGRMRLHDFHEVRNEYAVGIDGGIARSVGPLFLRGRDPQRGQPEGRFGGRDSFEFLGHRAGFHGQEVVEEKLALGDFVAAEPDRVGVRRELEIIFDSDGWDDEAEAGGHLLAQGRDTREQVAFHIRVNDGDELVADFDGHPVDAQGLFRGILRDLLLLLGLGLDHLLLILLVLYLEGLVLLLLFVEDEVRTAHKDAQGDEGRGGQPGHNPHQEEDDGADDE